jgi:hypothetical protein
MQNRKLRAFTSKELETVKAAQKLLGARTIGVGSARAEGGGGESWRRQINPQPAEMHKNGAENCRFCAHFGLKTAENSIFPLKVLNKIYSQDVFWEIH